MRVHLRVDEVRCMYCGVIFANSTNRKRFALTFTSFAFTSFVHVFILNVSRHLAGNAVKYVFSADTVLILIQYFLGQISVLNLTEFFIAWN